jgi:hypothetical protein
MMDDEELRDLMTSAALEFPVRGHPRDLRRAVVRRRLRGFAVAVAGVAAAVLVAVLVWPSSNTVVSVTSDSRYIGITWRLTNVVHGTVSTSIPADVGAWMKLMPSGQILVSDSVNSLSGSYTVTADGFKPHNVVISAVGFIGRDPHQLAAIAALDTMATAPAGDKVLNSGQTSLVVQAGAYRLTFTRPAPHHLDR